MLPFFLSLRVCLKKRFTFFSCLFCWFKNDLTCKVGEKKNMTCLKLMDFFHPFFLFWMAQPFRLQFTLLSFSGNDCRATFWTEIPLWYSVADSTSKPSKPKNSTSQIWRKYQWPEAVGLQMLEFVTAVAFGTVTAASSLYIVRMTVIWLTNSGTKYSLRPIFDLKCRCGTLVASSLTHKLKLIWGKKKVSSLQL